ncbi:TerC family protein [Microcella daejeonensis]|uniref:TerC family protein n=1 Tax=Microcella daejeonensis TaxID=2994971 RepID=A0A9E8S8D1_9MICO|nr:TerC family protein [Microcella daejeonensis]WAB81455.1 TerC family protein [Microcella daejeonensis]
MNVTPTVWLITIAITIAFFVYEFFAHVRKPHEPSIGESARWSAFYIGLALLFGVGLGMVSGWTFGGEYFAGYLTEKALSVDNLFVFLLVMTAFAVPKIYQQKVLMIGIVIALIMRGAFIAVGAALISNFSWVFYIFGALLLVLAYRQAFSHGDSDVANGRFMKLVRRVLPVHNEYVGDKLTTRIDGRRYVTPMLLVIVAIGFVDLIFAVDSIPAIYGLTEEAYIVFVANAFALMGLRQLYFLIGGLLERLVYLTQGLAVILAFIGVNSCCTPCTSTSCPSSTAASRCSGCPRSRPRCRSSSSRRPSRCATIASLLKTLGDRVRETPEVKEEVSSARSRVPCRASSTLPRAARSCSSAAEGSRSISRSASSSCSAITCR